VIVVGGGHNGLVAAAYLGKAGKRVCVIERRQILGGAAVTEEVVPGFRFSRASYVYSLFRPDIVKELDLHRHGLRLLPRVPSSFTPTSSVEGGYLLLGGGAQEDFREISKWSPEDAVAYARYNAFLEKFSAVLRPLLDCPPPDLSSLATFPPLFNPHALRLWLSNLRDAAFYGAWLASLGPSLPQFFELLAAPASKLLNKWFRSDILKATLATDAVIGSMISPSTPGSAYVLLHHVMCGVWCNVEGGMGALSTAIAQSAREAGVAFLHSAPVKNILTRPAAGGGGEVEGVELDSGEVLHAPIVLSTVAPSITLGDGGAVGAAAGGGLLRGTTSQSYLPPQLRDSLGVLCESSGSVKINLALSSLPNFICKPTPLGAPAGPHHRGTIHFESDMETLEAAFRDCALMNAPSTRPIIEMTLPSVLDPTLAPPGCHVALLFVQYAPYSLPGKPLGWDTPGEREAFAASVYAVIEKYAPGFTASILGADILTPLDLERIFGLPRGNISHGAMSLDQIAFLRPSPVASRYAVPGIRGLYMGGAGTHPGGGVMGAAGRNCARTILLQN